MPSPTETQATALVDAALRRIGDDGYCTMGRREAIRAVVEGRAAVLTRGRYHNQAAANAAYAVNASQGTVAEHTAEWAVKRSPRDAHRFVVEALYPLNQAGALQVRTARHELGLGRRLP